MGAYRGVYSIYMGVKCMVTWSLCTKRFLCIILVNWRKCAKDQCQINYSWVPNKRPTPRPLLVNFGIVFPTSPAPIFYLLNPPLFIIPNIFLLTFTEIDDLNINIQYQNFSNQIWEKHLKKDPYIGTMAH